MKTSRPLTKSPPTIARMALSVAQESIPPYSSKFSRKDFTQHQRFALMAPREFLEVDYRGPEQIPSEWAEPREVLGLEKVPDRAAIRKAAERPLEKGGPPPGGRGPCAARGHAA